MGWVLSGCAKVNGLAPNLVVSQSRVLSNQRPTFAIGETQGNE